MIFHKHKFHTLKKKGLLIFLFATCFLFTGCASRTATQIVPQTPDSQAASYQIGKKMTVNNPGEPFVIYDIKDALAYDGMYYAAWTVGDSIPYINADNKEVDLFDGQLYLLYTENTSEEEAVKTTQNWYNSAKENYQITSESSYTSGDIEFQVISYTYKGDNPYEKGISAFASKDKVALCIEFTARETLQRDITELMEQFLSCCSVTE